MLAFRQPFSLPRLLVGSGLDLCSAGVVSLHDAELTAKILDTSILLSGTDTLNGQRVSSSTGFRAPSVSVADEEHGRF